MSKFKIVWLCLLLVNSISLQYNKEYRCCLHSEILESLESCDGRNNHNMLSQPNVLTIFIHSIFKPGPNFIIKNKFKIMDKDQNNYYNTHPSDIYLAPSLCWVKRHNIYKETEKMKCEFTYLQTFASESQVDSFWSVCNMTATSSTYTIMYPTSTLKNWAINMYVAYKNGFHMGEIMSDVNKYS